MKRKIDPKKGFWDLPGGFIKPDESLEESVKREIKEELTVQVKMIKIIGVYSDIYLFQNVLIPTLGIIVLAKIVSGTITPEDDVADYKYFPKIEILKQKIAFESINQGLQDYLKTS